ncbi:MAG: tRNA (N6-isopentenyl adenosine(37)-C2)-methylthiotransferase MiaB [Acidobacteria bacterium]|nr:tRNA (N6-isopentenyl adenosine(37)-C2)-methylthiotransferase MiaB [Acidobacteriota bacterium]
MNVHDSERMAGLLEQAGFEATDTDDDADLVVINTCSVRERAEEKLYSRLGDIKGLATRSGRAPMVAVTGCVAQQEGAEVLAKSKLVDIVIGTQRVKLLPLLVAQAEGAPAPLVDISTPYDEPTFPLGLTRRDDPVKGFVTIVEGCNDYCSYCVVPYTRGHERMRAKAEILREVEELAGSGRREVQLLGQIVNHYQAPDDAGCDFAGLLEAVQEVRGIERIRFASPHPRHCSDRLIAAMRDLSKVCRHLHLPVQSGSTRVLKAMRRRHTRAEYLTLIEKLRLTLPDLQLSTDMIVGFPGETDDDFAETLSLTADVRFHSMFSFKYSPRPNTLAAQRMADDVPEVEKTRRIVALQALQKGIQAELHEASVGKTVNVLVDTTSRRRAWELAGRTSGNTVVNFPGDESWLGTVVPVIIERAGAYGVWGRPSAATVRKTEVTTC